MTRGQASTPLRWRWDREVEDALWEPAQRIMRAVRHCLDASARDEAQDLVVFIGRLKERTDIPHDVRRRLAEEVHGALFELSERAQRFAGQVLEAAPFAVDASTRRPRRGGTR